MLIKIICIGLCTVIVDIIVKQYKPEIAMLVNVTGGLIIFSMILNQANGMIGEFINLQNYGNISFDIVKPIIKVIGIGYITEFTADLAEDSGNKSISSKILLGGKIAICALALPIIKNLINVIISLI